MGIYLILLLIVNALGYFINEIYLSAGVLLLTFITFLFHIRKPTLRFIEAAMILFMLVAIIPVFYEKNLHFWGNWASLAGMFMVSYMIARQKVKNVAVYVLISLIIQTVIFIVQLFMLYVNKGGFVLKAFVQIPFGASNFIASAMLFNTVILLFWDKLRTGTALYRKLRIMLLITSLVIIVFTQSFSSVALFLCFFIYYFFKKSTFESKAPVIVFGLIIALISLPLIKNRNELALKLDLMTYEQKQIIEKTEEINRANKDYGFFHGRFVVYKTALRNFYDRPLLGKGLGKIVDYENVFYGLGFMRAHNLILDLLAQTGITGFLLYSFILIYFVLKLNRLSRRKIAENDLYKAVYLGLIAILIHSMVEPNFISFKFDIYIFSILSISLIKPDPEDDKQSSVENQNVVS